MSRPVLAAFGRAMRNPRVIVGGAIITVLAIVAIFAPWLAPHPPDDQNLLEALLPPAWSKGGSAIYPLGTDTLGRCLLSRVIYGARVALYVAVTASLGAALLGSMLAILASYFGGWVDWIVSRLVDIWMAVPPVVLALILMVGLGAGVNKVILAIVLIDWTRFCRVIRAEGLVIMKRDYIAAARLSGFTHFQTMTKELLPAVFPLLVTLLSIEMGIAVIVEAIMSFVGMSVEADVAAWGVLIADARQTMNQAPWGVVVPVTAIFLTVLAFNLLGDGLRRTLDSRLLVARG